MYSRPRAAVTLFPDVGRHVAAILKRYAATAGDMEGRSHAGKRARGAGTARQAAA